MKSSESVIRRMTRLAVQHRAVNLAQGFPNEAPPFDLVWGAMETMLGGTEEGADRLSALTLRDALGPDGVDAALDRPLRAVLERLRRDDDLFNQYSFPFGLRDLREAVACYTERWSGFRPDPETEVTISLGATEGLASALGSLCEPGDRIIVMQPFHEMYPSQARIFGLQPLYITLRENRVAGRWTMDIAELERFAASGARAMVFNSPHNPTGKVFDETDLAAIARVCVEHDVIAVTDEIYEHLIYSGGPHRSLATLPGMRNRTVVVNSISKTGNATGWRVGWVVASPQWTERIRGVHDTLVIQAPTPLQRAAIRLLAQPPDFYERLRAIYLAKRAVLVTALQHAGFRLSLPEGAYYLFADYRDVPGIERLAPMAAALQLIEQAGVACVPGDTFYAEGSDGDRYLRFAFCRSLKTLEEAARRLSQL